MKMHHSLRQLPLLMVSTLAWSSIQAYELALQGSAPYTPFSQRLPSLKLLWAGRTPFAGSYDSLLPTSQLPRLALGSYFNLSLLRFRRPLSSIKVGGLYGSHHQTKRLFAEYHDTSFAFCVHTSTQKWLPQSAGLEGSWLACSRVPTFLHVGIKNLKSYNVWNAALACRVFLNQDFSISVQGGSEPVSGNWGWSVTLEAALKGSRCLALQSLMSEPGHGLIPSEAQAKEPLAAQSATDNLSTQNLNASHQENIDAEQENMPSETESLIEHLNHEKPHCQGFIECFKDESSDEVDDVGDLIFQQSPSQISRIVERQDEEQASSEWIEKDQIIGVIKLFLTEENLSQKINALHLPKGWELYEKISLEEFASLDKNQYPKWAEKFRGSIEKFYLEIFAEKNRELDCKRIIKTNCELNGERIKILDNTLKSLLLKPGCDQQSIIVNTFGQGPFDDKEEIHLAKEFFELNGFEECSENEIKMMFLFKVFLSPESSNLKSSPNNFQYKFISVINETKQILKRVRKNNFPEKIRMPF